jgi:uncharacterized membrane protein
MIGWADLLLRSVHVIAGVMWVGLSWFLSFVNAQVTRAMDGTPQRAVTRELMPRAPYWFRWGALFTFATGMGLLREGYYGGGLLLPSDSRLSTFWANAIGMGTLFGGARLYDLGARLFRRRQELGALVFYVLVVAVAGGLARVFTGRAVLVHVGALLGIAMMFNTWLRIWPSQRKVIADAAAGKPIDAEALAIATERSRHNAYLSVPVLLLMIANHYPTLLYGTSDDLVGVPLSVAVIVGAGSLAVKLLFMQSAGSATLRSWRNHA